MSELHLCIPVLKRYDKLKELLTSLHASTVKPDVIHIIDNGQSPRRLEWACRNSPTPLDLFTPEKRMGVAESWNWFIANTPDGRVISNDDVTFAPGSLAAMVETPGVMVTALRGNAFSCFLLRDECVEKVWNADLIRIAETGTTRFDSHIGCFDEAISPGYAYFEDCDYEQRMRDAGVMFVEVDCGVTHAISSTCQMLSPSEMDRHAELFIVAQENYLTKWGRLPEGVERQVLRPAVGVAR